MRPMLRRNDVESLIRINGKNSIASFSRLSNLRDAKIRNSKARAVTLFNVTFRSITLNTRYR